MKLTLVNIYPKETMARYLLSSYILKAYLDKYFEYGDLYVNVINLSENSDFCEMSGKILKESPDIVGYSCYIWNIKKVLEVIKQIRSRSNIIHVLGGPEISLISIGSFSKTAADYYVIGVGEKIFLNLITYLHLKMGESRSRLPAGVAYSKGDKFCYMENNEYISNLDEIPSVYINGVIEDRLYANQQAFLETQRGCRFKCKYCVYYKNLPDISYYSLQRVFDELEHLIVQKKVSVLRIFDAIFTSDLARAKLIVKFLLKLKQRKDIYMPWIYWEFNYHNIDEEFIKLVASLKYREKICNNEEVIPQDRPQFYSDMMRDYTAINCVGIQSFNPKSLKAVGRISDSGNRLAKFMDMTRKHNIVLKMDIIMGLPFETFDIYFNGVENFLPKLAGTDSILNFHRFQLLPGSELEDKSELYHMKCSDDCGHMVVSNDSFDADSLAYAAKLTAVLSRVLNSPLRKNFFAAKSRSKKRFFEIIENMFSEIEGSDKFNNIKLVQNTLINDDYWNSDVYRDIPSQWISDYLKKLN